MKNMIGMLVAIAMASDSEAYGGTVVSYFWASFLV